MINTKLKAQPQLLLVGSGEVASVGAVVAGFDGVRGWSYHLAVTPEWQRSRGVTAVVATSIALRQRAPK